MSEWSYWSGCSVQCGIGVQERRRQKIRDPVNAGEKCGETQELKACFSNYCDENEIHGNGKYLNFSFVCCFDILMKPKTWMGYYY